VCGEGAEILLDVRLRNTLEHKMDKMGSRPDIVCSDCRSKAKENDAIWLISVRDDEKQTEGEIFNPYRTGSMVLLKKEALNRLVKTSITDEKTRTNLIEMIAKHVYFYLEDRIWDAYGLPRGEIGS
jgi:hypothetical protein